MTGYVLVWAPLIPWGYFCGFLLLAVLLIALGVFRHASGWAYRGAAVAILMLALAGPSLVQEDRQPQKDVALLVKDVSASQSIGDRAAKADAALAALQNKLSTYSDLDVRTITVGAASQNATTDEGTRAFDPIVRALADVPAERIAGVALITDGQVHDVPATDKLPFKAPLHVLLDGDKHEGDRRIIIKQAPTFGIVGKDVEISIRIEDVGDTPEPSDVKPSMARVTIRRDGGAEQVANLPVGADTVMRLTLEHGGPTVFEVSVDPGPQELTLDNNRAAIVVNGVRDRLKVLLISGEPHSGERSWRNLLKADPSVDLVHFTILRPPEKQDRTPVRELSLIAFPIKELFDVKLDEFDLIILDRYQRRGILPQNYLENVAEYVRHGGALLEAAGTSEETVGSIYQTPLGAVLPAEPTGDILEQGFKPKLTEVGDRHPVTAGLPGAPADADGLPSWGRWFRQVETNAPQGDVLMTGINDRPLLVLNRVGDGRVAQILSDQMWLWNRGFEGGGPQTELLRRLAYWLMKEPDLEENDLRASVDGERLTITRRSLAKDEHPVDFTRPNGKTDSVPLHDDGGGRTTATVQVAESGLYRVSDGTKTALAAVGALNPLELSDVHTTAEKLLPAVDATGGSVSWVGDGGAMPDIRRTRPHDNASGGGWIGFRANGDYVVTGIRQTELLPPWLALAGSLGALLLAWRREGR